VPHEILASIRVHLPDGHSEMAGALADIAQAWSNFLGEFQQYEASSEVTFAVNETRTKPGPKPQRKTREKPPTADDVRGILPPAEAA